MATPEQIFVIQQSQAAEPVETEDAVGGSVTMSRALAQSAHGLTLNEARVMMLACRLIDPRRSPYAYARDGYVKVRVTADEFAQLANMGGDRTPTAAYEGLKVACDKLFDRRASWREGKKQIRLAWVWKATYHNGEGWAEVCFSPDMTQHLFMLGEKFIRYRLELARGLRSLYSVNLLRLLMTQKDSGFLAITLEDFRCAMEIPKSYRYADINRYAILPPIKELQEKTNILIQHQEIKQGRSVHSLRFVFSENPQGSLPL
jgi:plasmid replication initiation protein